MKKHRKISLLLAFLMLFTLFTGVLVPKKEASAAVTVAGRDYPGSYDYSMAWQVLDLINQQRSANGCSVLTMDKDLLEAAMQRAAEISSSFSHTRPDGSSWTTITNTRATKTYGENIAAGQTTPQAAVTAWMNSAPHRSSILNNGFKSIGIGCYKSSTGYRFYWVQEFSYNEGTPATRPGSNSNIVYGKSTVYAGTRYTNKPNVSYRVHVQTYGWQNYVFNGATAGTSGQAKRLEGINIRLSDQDYSGGIIYRVHVQTYGWQGWIGKGEMAGTTGKAKRLEAIQIQLTGEIANHYDVYYRVHAQTYGWMGWARNGEYAGTSGMAKRLEAIQIILVPKGNGKPSRNYEGVYSNTTNTYYAR